MSSDIQAIKAYFFKLGLSSEIADIYLALNAYGAQTLSELARHSGIERTRLYRLLDELATSNLVEIETQYKRRVLHAAPISNLQILLNKKEQELRDLYRDLDGLEQRLAHSVEQEPGTRVQAYHGLEGLKQMFWNQTRASTENLSILHETAQTLTTLTFFERWVRTFNERHIKARTVFGDNFMRDVRTWYEKNTNERLAAWEGRYIPPSVFPITHSVVIYDDVTAYYNWRGGTIFGIEIYNEQVADTQRKFFEMLWAQGLSINVLKKLGDQLPGEKK